MFYVDFNLTFKAKGYFFTLSTERSHYFSDVAEFLYTQSQQS